MSPGNSLLGGKLAMDSHPIQGSSYTPKRLMRRKPGKAQVVFETILVISSCCFAEEEKEISKYMPHASSTSTLLLFDTFVSGRDSFSSYFVAIPSITDQSG